MIRTIEYGAIKTMLVILVTRCKFGIFTRLRHSTASGRNNQSRNKHVGVHFIGAPNEKEIAETDFNKLQYKQILNMLWCKYTPAGKRGENFVKISPR